MKTPTMRGALVALSMAGMVLFPAAASADDYSSAADSTGAVTCSIDPVTGVETCGTASENTVAANSQGGIIPDQPGTEQNEANDLTVATATPVRVETSDGTWNNPDSIAAVAPWDASGSSATGVQTVGNGWGEVHASTEGTYSEVDAHASTNHSTIDTWAWSYGEDVTVGTGDGRTVLPSIEAESWTTRVPNGTIAAGAWNEVMADGAQQGSMFDGFITFDYAWASSTSVADGVDSINIIDFAVLNLQLRSSEWGPALITINSAQNFLNEAITVIDATINGVNGVFNTLTGSDLLDRDTYAGNPAVQAAYDSIVPQLNVLTGIGGQLEALELRLGGGWSDDGNGDYARGMSQAISAEANLNGDTWTKSVVGYAYSGVDAVRAFSTATDPLWPNGVVPIRDEARAFPATRHAFPVETVFANGPAEAGTAVLGADDLPHTGLEIGALVLFGLLLVAGGFGTRRFSRAAA